MPKVTKVGKFRAKAAATTHTTVTGKGTSTGSIGDDELKSFTRPVNDSSNRGNPSVSGAANAKLTLSQPSGAADVKPELSRCQQKRLAKKKQYLRRNRMVMSALRLKREEDQRGKIDGLDAIREALRPIAKDGQGAAKLSEKRDGKEKTDRPATTTGTNRAKKDLVGKETARMGLVMEHPAFVSDPFGAIRSHLQNSLAGQAEEQRAASEERRKKEERTEKEKKEVKKEKLLAARVGTKSKWRGAVQRHARTGSKGRGGRSRR